MRNKYYVLLIIVLILLSACTGNINSISVDINVEYNTEVPTPVITNTPTPIDTATLLPSVTFTPIATVNNTMSPTFTATASQTSTVTSTHTETSTVTLTPSPTIAEPTATDFPTPTQEIVDIRLVVIRRANIRLCPTFGCEIFTVYDPGTEILAFDIVSGAMFEGSDQWWVFKDGDAILYIHEALVSDTIEFRQQSATSDPEG